MFAAASAALVGGGGRGLDAPSFRTFYLFGAILNVPWLALGTVYLLAGRRIGDGVRWGLVLASGFAAGVLVTAPCRAPVPTDELPEGQELFEPLPRILAAVGSGVAALVVIAGALWSAWRLARGRATGSRDQAVHRPRRLAAGNVVIALGTLVLSASGTLAGRLGKDTAFAVTLVAGVVILFCGFLIATPGRPGRAPAWLTSSQPRSADDPRSAQGAAQHLAGQVARQHVHEQHLGRALVAGQVVVAVGDDGLLVEVLRRPRARRRPSPPRPCAGGRHPRRPRRRRRAARR